VTAVTELHEPHRIRNVIVREREPPATDIALGSSHPAELEDGLRTGMADMHVKRDTFTWQFPSAESAICPCQLWHLAVPAL
jgi:hypothetical protein